MRIMILTDRKRILVTEDEETAVNLALLEKRERIMVKGTTYKSSMIGYFEDPTIEEMRSYFDTNRPEPKGQIEGARCHGSHSIQHQINSIIKDEYPLEWSKLIRSTKKREEVRMKLRETIATGWCDYRERECACEPN